MTVAVANERYAEPKSPLKAIRLKCLDCCVGSSNEVKLCEVDDCPLWTRRSGKTTKPKKPMSEENKKRAAERFKEYRRKKNGQ